MLEATQTMQAIENSITIDNGLRYKQLEKEILPLMSDAYKSDKGFRDHLGASVIGNECERKVWYSFRNIEQFNHNARLIRLWNRGHLEEGRFISALMCAGIDVKFVNENNKQFGYSFGWFGGSIDGIATNVPDLQNETVMLEFKTMSESRFKQFKTFGVIQDPIYYNQLQVNMYCMNKQHNIGFKNALFISVNKNTDEIFIEIVPIDEKIGEETFNKAIKIVNDNNIPFTLKPSKAYFPCKMCEYKEYCFDEKSYVAHSCKNCAMCQMDCLSHGIKCDLDLSFSEDCYVENK